MAIDNPMIALKYILMNNPVIAPMLGHYEGSVIPLINYGKLADNQTDLPCIYFENEILDMERCKEGSAFLIHIFAKTQLETMKIARAILKEFNGGQEFANGYPVNLSCSILRGQNSPVNIESETIVEMRLFNINGGA